MTESYLTTALWSSHDESTPDGGEPMDANYGIADIAPESVEKAARDCAAFMERAAHIIEQCPAADRPSVGHDFWLTRNHHGAGFWDGDYPEAAGKALTALAEEFGECDAVVGDDGKIYLEGGR